MAREDELTRRLPRLQSHRVSNAMSDKVLVTGASGLAGASLVRALLAQGREVRAMVHADRRALAGLDVEPFAADVRDPASLERAVAGVDVVYHLAATVSVAVDAGPAVEAVNVAGTRNVVAACLRGKVRRLVHFSSIEALRQEPLDQPVDETRARIDSEGDAPTSTSTCAPTNSSRTRRSRLRGTRSPRRGPSARWRQASPAGSMRSS